VHERSKTVILPVRGQQPFRSAVWN